MADEQTEALHEIRDLLGGILTEVGQLGSIYSQLIDIEERLAHIERSLENDDG